MAKKIIAYLLTIAMTASIAVAGTVAYLQSEDSDVNVMTLGNVKIEQHEYQRVETDGKYETKEIEGQNSYVLETFEQEKPLYPIVGDPSTGAAGWDDTIVRMTQVDSYGSMNVFAGKNAVDKFVTVENTGSSDAYIRTLVAIEIGSTDGSLIGTSYHNTWTPIDRGTIEIEGNTYMVIEYTYNGAEDVDRHVGGILPAGDTSYPNLSQVYLKSVADNDDMVAIDGNGNGYLDIIVVSQAIQTNGFADAEAAFAAGFPMGENNANLAAWFGGALVPEIPTIKVTTPEELREAMDDPELQPGTVIVGEGVTVEIKDNEHYYIPGGITIKNVTFDTQSRGSDYMIMTAGVGDTVTFENCTVERQNTGMTVIGAEAGGPNMVFNECEFKGPVAPNFVDQEDRTSQFNNCTFGVGTARIVMGFVNAMGGTHTFTGCSFDYTGGSTSGSNQYVRWNAVNSYSETDNSYSTTVILDGCTFTNCGTQRYGSNSTLTVK